ncbi:hypothetical protein CA13_24480 [Planctomycetes bacterium CA13]|uniref:Uncharacterized protein n=1 Tax=Novipirellula herctigrandis TaxID=2527986 RepID=A0A5C5Z2D6_9BACT|nr:hypothetical protein CA13_24480 [Planctomycetes bacterium CA13]
MTNEPQPEADDAPEQEATTTEKELAGPATVPLKSDAKQIAQFVTTIKNAEQQVGEHIIAALQHDNTVAVITTVAIGPDGQQRVISAALEPKRLEQVQEILNAATEEREEEEPCVGFHCLVKPKQ